MPSRNPEDRALIARIAASELWAKCPDRAAHTAPGRKAALDRFEKQVDPEGKLPPEERAIRAAHAKKAFYTRMALKSAQARRAKRGA